MKVFKQFGIVFLFFIISCNNISGTDKTEVGIEVGQKGPDFTYTSLEGSEVSLSDYDGKVILLYMFGNTCPNCLASGNQVETQINEVFFGTGEFQALGLDTWNSSSTVASVTAFKNRTGITFPLLRQAGSIEDLYGTTYDRLIVLDKNGVIQFKGTSVVSSDITKAVSKITSLLN